MADTGVSDSRTQELPPLDVADTLGGKSLLIVGTTGFVGKVALSMLLARYPGVGRVYVLVRPGMGNTAEERFFTKVATSPAFDPVREIWGAGYDSFMREKVIPIAGDIGRPLCNFDDAQFAAFEAGGGLDCVINSAGLVSFQPSLESAIRINAAGAENVLATAKRAGAALVHISTCYVAGRRDGEIWEDEPVVGYFPRADELRDDDFSAPSEMEDCRRIIDQVRALASDRAHISEFRERAARTLESQRRDPDAPANLRLAVARERKLWMSEQLVERGMERAEHWGWTNTYTYTKSLGEQIILADSEVRSTIVRPAIVESALEFPFAGWNEGFNTTAPILYLALKGHRRVLAGKRRPIDIIPVDLVSAGIIQAAAAVIADRHHPVYQCAASDINPVWLTRIVELSGLAIRRHYRAKADAGEDEVENRIRARLETYPVEFDKFHNTSAPRFKRLADRLSTAIDDHLPTWGAPRLTAIAERAKDELGKVSDFTGQVADIFDLFKPFIYDHDIRFRCDNTRALNAQLTPHDQRALRWNPEDIDWRDYWMNSHFTGLVKWVFPILDDEFGPKPRSVYTYKDLLELFHAATKLHKHRVAMRLLPTQDEDAEPVVYTYDRIRELARDTAGWLQARGVEPGDRVVVMSENRPAWGICYFAILEAGAAAVPLDSQLSLPEVANLIRASGAKVALISHKVCERLRDDHEPSVRDADTGNSVRDADTGNGVRDADTDNSVRDADTGADLAWVRARLAELEAEVELTDLDDAIEAAPADSAPAVKVRGDHLASLIYTSGTTGEPKGVMLTHKNLTSVTSKMSAVFKLYRHDGLLSVLPLHHTFEFSAGLLMPLVHGASITYLDEIESDALTAAFDEGNVTAMVGVPALWQLLHRRIFKTAADRGTLVLRAFEALVDGNRALRDRAPWGLNLGRLLFWPVHRKLGGRLRLLISGGSALSPDVMEKFLGLGFRLFEGYGMTEASPVIAVQRPGDAQVIGSVGRALPGVDVKIDDPDPSGVGEIVAKGPNVMKGYYQNPDATDAVLSQGWLHTGDLGKIDDRGNVFVVGRKKEMILGTSGENVYPDELEDIYRDSAYVDELSVVGLPQPGGGETVAALVVPDYDQDGVNRETVRERVREHMRVTSQKLPRHKRIAVYHLWDHALPKTSTRKIKRREVTRELERLEDMARSAARTASDRSTDASALGRPRAGDPSWVRDVIAQVTQRPRSDVTASTRLEALGVDSLMITEIGVALEAAGAVLPDPAVLAELETVGDVEAMVARNARAEARSQRGPATVPKRGARRTDAGNGRWGSGRKRDDDDEIPVPELAARLGRRGLRAGLRALYDRWLDTSVTGAAYVPPTGGFIVAANHASHLDTGLVKHALGDQGELLVALAAKDYFFDDPVRRAYFENFTNLVPMERYGSLRESLRLAGEVLRDGHILLIFPEGTRSVTGVMTDFKPSLGYLALNNQCGILPVYLAGTHDALPKGGAFPKRRAVAAHIGPFFGHRALRELAGDRSRAASYRVVSAEVERAVRGLAPTEYEWTLGEAGRRAVADLPEAPADEPTDDTSRRTDEAVR